MLQSKMPPKYKHIYLIHHGTENMWSYTTDVLERICLIVVFIICGHAVFTVRNLTIAFMSSFLSHTDSFWAAYFSFKNIQPLYVRE